MASYLVVVSLIIGWSLRNHLVKEILILFPRRVENPLVGARQGWSSLVRSISPNRYWFTRHVIWLKAQSPTRSALYIKSMILIQNVEKTALNFVLELLRCKEAFQKSQER
jgi:hypothetical protein